MLESIAKLPAKLKFNILVNHEGFLSTAHPKIMRGFRGCIESAFTEILKFLEHQCSFF